MTGMKIFLLIVAGLLPVIGCAVFSLLEKKTPFGKLAYWIRQAVIGVVFGGLTVMATEVFSIDIGSALINARDAAAAMQAVSVPKYSPLSLTQITGKV